MTTAPTTRTERDKMIAGELYDASEPGLLRARARARRLTARYNATDPDAAPLRAAILRELLGEVGPAVSIEPPFFCDYGDLISIGEGSFINFGMVALDCAPIRIGRRVLIGPGVHLYAGTHTVEPDVRRRGLELARPITIDDDAWIGGGAIIGPGVRIGAASVVGAGSVVTRDVPPGVVVVGQPARILRAVDAPREAGA